MRLNRVVCVTQYISTVKYLSPLLDLSIIKKQPKLHGIQLPTFFEVYLKNPVLKISFLSIIIYVKFSKPASAL